MYLPNNSCILLSYNNFRFIIIFGWLISASEMCIYTNDNFLVEALGVEEEKRPLCRDKQETKDKLAYIRPLNLIIIRVPSE